MKKAIAKIITFMAVFILSLVVIGFFMNHGNTDMTAQMSGASLPVVAFRSGEWEINRMYGYCTPMETAGMRWGITPIDGQRQVNAVIHTCGQEIAGIAYEVRSIDGSRLIENTEVEEFEVSDSEIGLSFRLKDLIEEGKEYSLIFLLTLADGRQARYYARVCQAEDHLAEKLDFVTRFSEATFDYDRLVEEGFIRKLEPNADGDNTTLAKVNIHSSARQVTWGDLKAERVTEPEICVRETGPQTASVVLDYLVRYPVNGKNVYAQTEEYYRVRYTGENMYLLDYERTMEQLLEESAAGFTGEKLSLGIVDPDIQILENDGGTAFSFVNAGSLYSYNATNNRLARLFSFRDGEEADSRTLYRGHGYRILQVDEAGNVVFLVSGYMSRGRHEGACGVQVCYYNSGMNVVEEMAFIPYYRSPEILQAEIDSFSYVNMTNDLYLMLDGSIFHVSLENQSSDVIDRAPGETGYRAAEDGSMLAWQEGGRAADERTLLLMNLDSGETSRISAGTGYRIRPLGFMGQDLIYGLAPEALVQEDFLGHTVFPMERVVICDFEGKILKVYREKDLYVTDCEVLGNQIVLQRVRKTEEGFEEANPDQILYSEEVTGSRNTVETAVTENLQTVVQIALRSEVDAKNVQLLTPKEVLFEGSRDVALRQEERPDRYCVYGRTGVQAILSSPSAAVQLAYENMGTVAAEDGSYVFKRDRLHTANQIMAITEDTVEEGETSLSVCLDAMFRFEGLMRSSAGMLESGKDVAAILEDNLEGYRILDLRGASLDMVLYYPDREIPVLAVLQDGSAVLITGFNEQNVVLMDPTAGTVAKMGLNDAREWFAENGNRFMTYWK